MKAEAVLAGHSSPNPRHLGAQVWRYLDLVLLAVSLVPAVVLGAPKLGYLVGAGGWVLQRVLAVTDRRWTGRVTAPVRRLGVDLFEAFGRIWLQAGAIILAAVVGGHRDGLTAALVIFFAYSVAFLVKVTSGPPSGRTNR